MNPYVINANPNKLLTKFKYFTLLKYTLIAKNNVIDAIDMYNPGSSRRALGVNNTKNDVYMLMAIKPQSLKNAKNDSDAVMSSPNDSATDSIRNINI